MAGNSTQMAPLGGGGLRYTKPLSPVQAAFSEALAELETTWTDPARVFVLTLPLLVSLALLLSSVIMVDALQVIALVSHAVETISRALNRASGFLVKRSTTWVRSLTEMAWSTFKLALMIGVGPTVAKLGYKLNVHAFVLAQQRIEPLRQGAYDNAQAFAQTMTEHITQGVLFARETIQASGPLVQDFRAFLIQFSNAVVDGAFIVASLLSSSISLDWLQQLPSLRLSMIPKTAFEDDILRATKLAVGAVLLIVASRRLARRLRASSTESSEVEEDVADQTAAAAAVETEEEEEEHVPVFEEKEEQVKSEEDVVASGEADVSSSEEEMPELESPISTPSVKGSPAPAVTVERATPMTIPRSIAQQEVRMSPAARFTTPVSAAKREIAAVTPFITPLDASQESSSAQLDTTNESLSFNNPLSSSEMSNTSTNEDEENGTRGIVEPSVIDLSLEDSDDEEESESKPVAAEREAENTTVNTLPHVKPEQVKVNLQVTVLEDNRPGAKYRSGGVGKITKVHGDGTVNVKLAVEGGQRTHVEISRLLLGAHPTAYGVKLQPSESSGILSRPVGDTVASRMRARGLLDTSNQRPVAASPGMKPLYRPQRGPVTRTALRRTAATNAE